MTVKEIYIPFLRKPIANQLKWQNNIILMPITTQNCIPYSEVLPIPIVSRLNKLLKSQTINRINKHVRKLKRCSTFSNIKQKIVYKYSIFSILY